MAHLKRKRHRRRKPRRIRRRPRQRRSRLRSIMRIRRAWMRRFMIGIRSRLVALRRRNTKIELFGHETPLRVTTVSSLAANTTVQFNHFFFPVLYPQGTYNVSLMTEHTTNWAVQQWIYVYDYNGTYITSIGELPYSSDPDGNQKNVVSNYGGIEGEPLTEVIETFTTTGPGFRIVVMHKNLTSCVAGSKITYRMREVV